MTLPVSLPVSLPEVANAGDLDQERVAFRATEDLDLTRICIFCCQVSQKGVPQGWDLPAAYWLPNKTIKKGDYVVLYTKEGNRREKLSEDGPSSYFYYWNRSNSLWSHKTIPVIVKVDTWAFTDPPPRDEPQAAT
jgi:hypothetical protein